MALGLGTSARNAAADAVAALLNTGYIRIYSGTRATNPGTAIGAQVLLAELRFNATAFGAASGGVATANAITADSAANATGTATWARLLASDGTTAIADCDVATSASDIVMNSVAIQSGAEVRIDSLTYTQPAI